MLGALNKKPETNKMPDRMRTRPATVCHRHGRRTFASDTCAAVSVTKIFTNNFSPRSEDRQARRGDWLGDSDIGLELSSRCVKLQQNPDALARRTPPLASASGLCPAESCTLIERSTEKKTCNSKALVL